MRHSHAWLFASSALLLAAVAPLSCKSSKGGATGTTDTGGSGAGGSTSTGGNGQGGGFSFGDGGMDPVVSISITPQNPTIEVLNDVVPMATQFVATGLTKGGGMVPLTGAWSYNQLDVASLNPSSGAFTASGLVGGTGTVTFSAGGLTATTTATVKLHYTQNPQMVPTSTITMFGQASTPDPALTVLYPYDKTVFPRGLAGPVIQWNGGNAADIYYVHAVSPTFEYEFWGTVPPPSQYAFPTMPDDIWKKLTDSTTGNISVSVQRNDGSQPYTPVTRTWSIAPANLTGTIYYWAVSSGNVMRIKPGDTSSESFLQLPQVPAAPVAATCVACHSVSKNGTTVVAAFNGSASPWGTFDATTGNSLYSSGTDPNNGPAGSGFEGISPDGSLVVFGQERQLPYLILSPFNDATNQLAQLDPGAAGGYPVYPSWSGDGGHVAFAVRTDGNWLDFNTTSLWTTDIDTTTHLFSNTHQIVTNTADRSAVIYPTWSPDSSWIAFERSTQARSRGALGDVWIAAADGSSPVALDQANGTGLLTGPEISSTYEPTFMPVSVGGYFWLIVVSERTYGNTLTVTDPTTRTKQLWVTAIDATLTPGQDPSHPSFWLPGQDPTTNNMRGEWTLSPCKMLGDTCTAGYDCCGGFCQDNGMGMLTCSSQSSGCSMVGDKCTTAADCCDPSANCTGGFCASSQPQ
jgi:WD40-like Beta Propeller Repeat